ncbi:hypothetical protein [Cryptosporangium phraense]|uniref:Uncharacterized protein n=1 Tax=Cryptosporangium phraense TaxID=2593070 RepID=A0A545AX82_9ACTN|nr:hypothetical protein [Cryptosporangium phraense]TQS45891.1 hypothetical protein FL583_05145 [Cryptosporangium phraense]
MDGFVRQDTIGLQLGPRPLALGVAEADLEQLTLAFRAASSMWGGRRFPIVAIDLDGQPTAAGGALQLIDVAGVAGLIDFSGRVRSGTKVALGAFEVDVAAARPLDDGRQWSPSAFGVHTDADLQQMQLVEAADDDAFGLAAVGRLACRDELEEWRSHGGEVVPVDDSTLVSAQLNRCGVIDSTLHRLSTSYASGAFLDAAVFVYVAPEVPTFEDLQWFWNTRALRPSEGGTDLLITRQLADAAAADIQSKVRAVARSSPTLFICSLSVPTDELQEILHRFEILEHAGSKWTDFPVRKSTIEPTAVVNTEFRNHWQGARRYGAGAAHITTAIYRPTTIVDWPNPVPYRSTSFGAPVELGLSGNLIEVPQRPAVAELFLSGSRWAGPELRVPTRLYPRYQLPLHLPDPDAILRAATSLNFRQSDKARQLRAVLAHEAGRLDFYREPAAIAVIEALTPADSRGLRRALEHVSPDDRDYLRAAVAAFRDRVRTLDDVATSLQQPAPSAPLGQVARALNELVARGHVVRGLRADCSVCDTQELRHLDDAPPQPVCRACRAPAAYKLADRGEPALHYRLSPAMRIISANGGLPVLAAAAVLEAEGAYVVGGAEPIDGPPFEVDLLGWHKQDVLAGEAKRRAPGFTDVASDVGSSAKFGATVHIAATLEPVDDALREQLEAACDEHGLRLRVLDGPVLLTADTPSIGIDSASASVDPSS